MICYSYLSTVFVLVLLLIQTYLTQADSTMTETDVVQKVNTFALDMYRMISQTSGNIFFSPISIFSALSMTSLGAKENTLTEMLSTLKIENHGQDEIHQWYKSFSQGLFNRQTQQDYTLSLANRLFGEQSYTFLDKFLQDTLEYYNAKLETLNFKEKFEESRRHINDWVSNQTNAKIKDILAPEAVDAMTKLVLVNAIYFKGEWLSKFQVNKTKESDFYVTNADVISVPMMHEKLNASHGYSESLKSDILELPYKGEDLSMVVLLPNLEETTMAQLEQSITPSTLSSLSLRKSKVDVWLPKFKMESSFNLKDKLQQMGMSDLFSEGKADLSGMSGSNDLYVSSVVHKAFVEVNEEGSEAAAATAAVFMTRSMVFTPEFKADHPFLFYIKDTKRNSILFFGRFIKP